MYKHTFLGELESEVLLTHLPSRSKLWHIEMLIEMLSA